MTGGWASILRAVRLLGRSLPGPSALMSPTLLPPPNQPLHTTEVLARLAARLAAQQAANETTQRVLCRLLLLRRASVWGLTVWRWLAVRSRLTVRRRRTRSWSWCSIPAWRPAWSQRPERVVPGRGRGIFARVYVEPNFTAIVISTKSDSRNVKRDWASGRTPYRTPPPNLEAMRGCRGSADPTWMSQEALEMLVEDQAGVSKWW